LDASYNVNEVALKSLALQREEILRGYKCSFHYRKYIEYFNLSWAHPAAADYNNGMTLVYQVGHWFGLSDTFQDDGGGNNAFNVAEMIPDNSASEPEAQGSPSSCKSCPDQPGNGPIHNFLDTPYK
jgi:hypothetical protein